MQLNVSNSVFLGAVVALALLSVGLKATAGPPDDGLGPPRSSVDEQLVSKLKSQGFVTSLEEKKFDRSIIYGKRSNCALSARDARTGAETTALFARDASKIGPVRYLYRGSTSDQPLTLAAWLGRFENKVLDRLHVERRVPIPIALATSPGCGGQNFGLTDFRV